MNTNSRQSLLVKKRTSTSTVDEQQGRFSPIREELSSTIPFVDSQYRFLKFAQNWNISTTRNLWKFIFHNSPNLFVIEALAHDSGKRAHRGALCRATPCNPNTIDPRWNYPRIYRKLLPNGGRGGGNRQCLFFHGNYKGRANKKTGAKSLRGYPI